MNLKNPLDNLWGGGFVLVSNSCPTMVDTCKVKLMVWEITQIRAYAKWYILLVYMSWVRSRALPQCKDLPIIFFNDSWILPGILPKL